MGKYSPFWIIPAMFILPAVCNAADKVDVKGNGFGCIEPKQIIRILELSVEDRDTEAAVRLLKDRQASGDCHPFVPGQQVYVEKGEGIGPMKDWICIRPVGDPSCYWTHANVVRGREGR
jgi:hypothetical protein